MLVVFALNATAQTEGKWSVGVGYTPSIVGGQTFTGYINRHLGEKWQVGVMPFGFFYKDTDSSGYTDKSHTIGLNLSTRFAPYQFKLLKPYIYAFTGYGLGVFKYSNQYSEGIDYSHNLDFSLGIGTEIRMGDGGWAIDLNVGSLLLKSENTDGSGSGGYLGPIFSVGILKRFGK